MSEAVQSLPPRRLDAREAAWTSSLLGVKRVVSFEWDSEPVAIEWDAVVEPPPSTAFAKFRIGGVDFAIHLDNWTELAAARRLLGEARFDLLPADVQVCVLEAAFAEPLDLLAGALGVECGIVGFEQAEPEGRCISFTMRHEEKSWIGCVVGGEHALSMFATWCEGDSTAAMRDPSTLPVKARLAFDPIPLSDDELASLEAGDLLALSEDEASEGLVASLFLGSRRCARVKIESEGITVASIEPLAAANGSTGMLIIEATPPQLTCCNAESLSVGSVLEAWEPSGMECSLAIKGREIGRGAFVRNRGRVYMRVLHWDDQR